jgi:hypothetical protein
MIRVSDLGNEQHKIVLLPAKKMNTAEKPGSCFILLPYFCQTYAPGQLAPRRYCCPMMQKIWLKIRRIGFELYCFFTAPLVVKNCLGLFSFLTGLFLLTFWWLKCYTNHGESLQVPNFVGMGYREATQKARARDFEVIVNDSMYVPGKPPGEVVAQNPEPESRVKEGRTLYFTVTKNNPDIIKLPELAGSDDYDLYSRKISRLGLKPRILSRVADPILEPNTIVRCCTGAIPSPRKSAGATNWKWAPPSILWSANK